MKKVLNLSPIGLLLVLGISLVVFMSHTALFSTHTLKGKVVEQEEKTALEGVHIVLEMDNGTEKTILTNSDGGFKISDLPMGHGKLQASKEGFETAIIDKIVISEKQIPYLVIKLKKQDTNLQTP